MMKQRRETSVGANDKEDETSIRMSNLEGLEDQFVFAVILRTKHRSHTAYCVINRRWKIEEPSPYRVRCFEFSDAITRDGGLLMQ
jgi:hypothetical protein